MAGQETPEISRRELDLTRIYVMALDGIVNVNSLFTFALFLGLAWYPTTDPTTNLIGNDSSCAAGTDVGENLISHHVYSFSFFLFSSIIALTLKQAVKIGDGGSDVAGEVSSVTHLHFNAAVLRVGVLASAIGSVFGCGFLMMAMVALVQIKLGAVACGCFDSLAAITAVVVLVPLALSIYLVLLVFSFVS